MGTAPGDLTFGARLKQQREQLDIALDTIAAETKIKSSLLEGLERDDLSKWPEGIYRRAYVRAYAQRIGLEPDATVREFLEQHPDSVEMPPAATGAWPEPERPAQTQPATKLRRLVTSAMAAMPTFLQRAEAGEPARSRATMIQYEGEVVLPATAPVVREEIVPRTEPLFEESRSAYAPDLAPPARPVSHVGLAAAAELCTRLGRASDRRQLEDVLEDVTRVLEAVGLVVWSWDPRAAALTPSLVRGYPDALRSRLPAVAPDAANAVAAAYRATATCVVEGGNGLTGAVVVPLLAPDGCAGVLALEFDTGREQLDSVRDLAAIVAAQLVPLFGSTPLAHAITA